jgi:putative ABC transport system permease protein
MMLIRTLLKHYRRHPVQGLFLLVGIVVANVLLAGTLVINAQARASYGQGEQFLSARDGRSTRKIMSVCDWRDSICSLHCKGKQCGPQTVNFSSCWG